MPAYSVFVQLDYNVEHASLARGPIGSEKFSQGTLACVCSPFLTTQFGCRPHGITSFTFEDRKGKTTHMIIVGILV